MNIKLFSAALLATSIASAATPVDGWYASVFGGYTYMPDNINLIVDGLYFNGSSYNNGYNVGGRVGYKNNPLRYELEYTYITASTSSFAVDFLPQTGSSGSNSGNVIMANIYYDFPDMLPAISPFLGVGIGYASLQANLYSDGPVFGGFYLAENENLFSYQATLGLTYNFSENYAVNLAYRFLATSQGGNFGRVFQANMASIGGIFRFDQGSYK